MSEEPQKIIIDLSDGTKAHVLELTETSLSWDLLDDQGNKINPNQSSTRTVSFGVWPTQEDIANAIEGE
jgi:hypothetical protein